jgi:hypothetical protein
LAAKYLKVLIPYLVVLVDGILAVFWYLKEYLLCFTKVSCVSFDVDTDSTYEELLTKSKLPTLKIRRIRTIAIETFKIVNITSPLYLHDLITIKQSKYSFRYQNTASIPSTRTTRYGIKTFNRLIFKVGNLDFVKSSSYVLSVST